MSALDTLPAYVNRDKPIRIPPEISAKAADAAIAACPVVTWEHEDREIHPIQPDGLIKIIPGLVEHVPWLSAGPPPADRLVRQAQAIVKRAAPKRIADAAEATRAADALAKELLIARRELSAKSSDLELYRQRCEQMGAQMIQQQQVSSPGCDALTVDGARYTQDTVRLLRNCEREASSQLRSATLQVDGLAKTVTALRGQLAQTEQALAREKLEHEATQRRLGEAREKQVISSASEPKTAPVACSIKAWKLQQARKVG